MFVSISCIEYTSLERFCRFSWCLLLILTMLRECSCILLTRKFHTTGLGHITCLSLLIANCLNFSFCTWEDWSFIWFDYFTNWRGDHNLLKWCVVKHFRVFVPVMASGYIQMLCSVQFLQSWFDPLIILWSKSKLELCFTFLLKLVISALGKRVINKHI